MRNRVCPRVELILKIIIILLILFMMISPESRLKLEMVILPTLLGFLAILTFQYVNYKFMRPDFNKH